MNSVTSSSTHPVSFFWTFKKPLGFIGMYGLFFIGIIIFVIILITSETNKPFPISLIAFITIFLTIILVLIFLTIFIFQYLLRKNFGFSIEEDFFIFNQGIISKEQKNLPYGVIQNIIITQDLLDRVLGLYSLIIENAASSGSLMMAYKQNLKYPLSIGFYGNTAIIPGLTKDSSEELKKIILNKMKTKSFNDDRSGL